MKYNLHLGCPTVGRSCSGIHSDPEKRNHCQLCRSEDWVEKENKDDGS